MGQAVRPVVSVSLATRGQTDIRGLVTCRTGCSAGASRWSSNDERGTAKRVLLLVLSRVAPRAATSGRHRLAAHAVVRLVVEDRQRPTPARQLTGHGDIGDDGLLLTGDEGLPPLVQPMVTGVPASFGRR